MGDPKDTSDDIADIHREIGRIFRDFFRDEELLGRGDFPAVDILETNDSLKIEIEVPGLEKSDIKLEISGDTLILEGIKRDCEKDQRSNYICMERRFGYFRRTVTLPMIGDASNITAIHENGILTILLPKLSERRRAVKKVEIE